MTGNTALPEATKSKSSTTTGRNDRLAATKEFHRSPVLIPAVSSRYPTPLPRHYQWASLALALLVPSLFYIGPAMLLLFPPVLYWFVSPSAALALVVIDVVLVVYPVREWPWFRGVFQLWYERFDFHHNMLLEENDKPVQLTDQEMQQLLVCCMHPHGIIPIQALLWMAFCDQYLPQQYGFGGVADVVTFIPLLRQILGWGSAGSASRHVLYRTMKDHRRNLFLLPGGIAEIFLAHPGTHAVKATRRGLMKLALQTGAALVPVYVFGGTDFYHHYSFSEQLSRSAKTAFTLFYGQYGLPLPYSVKCSMVLADPLILDNAVPQPSDEQIEELLVRYIDALRRLFEQYKAQAGYPNEKLEIR